MITFVSQGVGNEIVQPRNVNDHEAFAEINVLEEHRVHDQAAGFQSDDVRQDHRSVFS
jgi:hypothetical protein